MKHGVKRFFNTTTITIRRVLREPYDDLAQLQQRSNSNRSRSKLPQRKRVCFFSQFPSSVSFWKLDSAKCNEIAHRTGQDNGKRTRTSTSLNVCRKRSARCRWLLRRKQCKTTLWQEWPRSSFENRRVHFPLNFSPMAIKCLLTASQPGMGNILRSGSVVLSDLCLRHVACDGVKSSFMCVQSLS